MILIPLLVMSPFMTLAIIKEKWYPYFFVMARIWGKFIFQGLVPLFSKPDERPSQSALVAMKWFSPADDSKISTLVIAFEDGKYLLLRGENDNRKLKI